MLAGCRMERPAEVGRETAPTPPPIRAGTGTSPLDGWVGVVVAGQTVEIAATATATVDEIRVRAGDTVRAGDVLATLDGRLDREELAAAEAALRAAGADLERARLAEGEQRERHARRVAHADLVSREDLAASEAAADRAGAERRVAEARGEQERARLRLLQTRARQSILRAPFAGRVAARHLEPGARVTAGTPVVRLASAGAPLVRFAVPEPVARGLRPGTPVETVIEGSPERHAARVRVVAPEVDVPSQSIFVEAELSEAAALVPGQGARVRIAVHGR